MMAYIQILAIVLCSCFIQDAFSLKRDQSVKSTPANAMAPSLSARDGGLAKQVSTVRRMNQETAKDIKAPASPSPKPPKYPNLTAVKNMFWNALEDINRQDKNGRLVVRSARNTLKNVFDNELFWSAVAGAIKRQVKVTNDLKRADGRIQMCNNLTGLITAPDVTEGFLDVANEVYASVVHMQSKVGTNALRLVTEMVNGDEVTNGLDTISNIVTKIELNPRMLIKGFALIRKTINMSGSINMTDKMAKTLMLITSKFNK